ncbi:MAG: DUF4331 domain-containing protein [Janthinobacterium lividum]
MNLKTLFCATAALGALAAFSALGSSPVHASSHSDAPLIMLDPQANLTDVYAFRRNAPDGTPTLVVEVSVHPFSEPGDGVTYDSFSDDALYSIHIANPITGAQVQRYDFKFSPVSSNAGSYKNLNTILRYGRGADINGAPDAGPIMNVGDAHQNFVQTYTVTKTVTSASGQSTVNQISPASMTLMVPPYNTGIRTTPAYDDPNTGKAVSGASSYAGLDTYTRETTYTLPAVPKVAGQTMVFAGSREDGFYADTPGIFDFLDPRILSNTKGNGLGQDGTGVDGFKGFNVLHYAIVIPLSDLPSFAYQGAFTSGGTNSGVGVYASVSRPRITLRSTVGDNTSSGPYIQVNREANPLFNEVLVAIKDKDNYNRDLPTSDASKYKTYALNPEVATLINAVYGTKFVTTNRTDLAAVYVPDVIRVDTTTGPVHASGETGFNRLGFIGGDTIKTASGATVPGGWPNGRRLGDDVVDIALTAVASGPSYSTVTLLGDNIDHNDQVYNTTFPYAGTPNAGTRNSKDSGPNVGG